ncbi:hypothetical protein ACQP2K_22020 [Microbispora siamensis]
MEIELFPVSRLNPDLPGVSAPLRGRFVTHVRIAFSGAEGGEEMVQPLREIGPTLMDTVRDMPYAEVGTIHHEPTDAPYEAYDRNPLLREIDKDSVDTLLAHAGPDAQPPFIAELRHFGGAYARPPEIPNCVGGRDAAFSLFAGATPALESRGAARSPVGGHASLEHRRHERQLRRCGGHRPGHRPHRLSARRIHTHDGAQGRLRPRQHVPDQLLHSPEGDAGMTARPVAQDRTPVGPSASMASA